MLPYGRKNPLPFPYSLSSANFAVQSQKETGFIRVETLVSTLMPLAVGTAHPARRQRRFSCFVSNHVKEEGTKWPILSSKQKK